MNKLSTSSRISYIQIWSVCWRRDKTWIVWRLESSYLIRYSPYGLILSSYIKLFWDIHLFARCTLPNRLKKWNFVKRISLWSVAKTALEWHLNFMLLKHPYVVLDTKISIIQIFISGLIYPAILWTDICPSIKNKYNMLILLPLDPHVICYLRWISYISNWF